MADPMNTSRIEVARPEAQRFYSVSALPGNTLLPREREFVSSYAIQYANAIGADGRPVVEEAMAQRLVDHGLAPEHMTVTFKIGNREGSLLFRRL